jgi:hypothetical protein
MTVSAIKMNHQFILIVRKKEENFKGALLERTLRLRERNEELHSHVQTFKMERSRMYDLRAEKISLDLIKTEEKIVSKSEN